MDTEIITANDIVQLEEKQDEKLLNMLNKEKHQTPTADNLPPQAYCPICKCDMLQVTEIAEGDSGRGVFKYFCLDCGTEFYLLEDKIASALRNINNALDEIENANERIKYQNEKIREM